MNGLCSSKEMLRRKQERERRRGTYPCLTSQVAASCARKPTTCAVRCPTPTLKVWKTTLQSGCMRRRTIRSP